MPNSQQARRLSTAEAFALTSVRVWGLKAWMRGQESRARLAILGNEQQSSINARSVNALIRDGYLDEETGRLTAAGHRAVELHPEIFARIQRSSNRVGSNPWPSELELHYQPIIRLADEHPVALEALVRWQHPKLGLLQPAQFLANAEQSGAIVGIGEWVLYEACKQAALWRRLPGHDRIRVSINVSEAQLRDARFRAAIRSSLDLWALDPSALQLEINASVIADAHLIDRQLGALRQDGLTIAMDGFGAHDSPPSPGGLHIDALKVDRSFVAPLHRNDQRAEAAVTSIIDLSREAGLLLIAEGVETDTVVERLRLLGAEFAQGFHWAQPMPRAETHAWLQERQAA